jgi:hypothetical protein
VNCYRDSAHAGSQVVSGKRALMFFIQRAPCSERQRMSRNDNTATQDLGMSGW